MNKRSLHSLILSDFNSDLFRNFLIQTSQSLSVQASAPAFGQVMQTLMSPEEEIWENPYDLMVIWTRPEGVIPSFNLDLGPGPVDLETLLNEVDQFSKAILQVKVKAGMIIVPSWVLADDGEGGGVFDMKVKGLRYQLMRMNLRLAENLNDAANIFVLDTRIWLQPVGAEAFSPKLWYMSKIPFHPDVFKAAAQHILAVAENTLLGTKKIIILDLDDTLWGGVIGETGWQGIQLGGHDPIGEAFVDFQRALKSLQQRGILLAMVSKNQQAVVEEAFEKHPEMVLNKSDFAAMRINWKDKAENIIDLMKELNLGLSSAVFIDNSAFERARIQEALPEVLVPDWPEDLMLYKVNLSRLRCFDTTVISVEDQKRTEMVAQEKERHELKQQLPSLDEWIRTLAITISVEDCNEGNQARVVQLFNKTNQMNLTTRRLTEKELTDWLKCGQRCLKVFRVRDRFGDYGLTGIISLDAQGEEGWIIDFILSCRVMGRRVEETMLHVMSQQAGPMGLKKLFAEYIPTSRNQPCQEFFKRSGLQEQGSIFTWDLKEIYPCPQGIKIQSPPGGGS